MARPQDRLIIDSIINLLEGITVGGNGHGLAVGDGTDPNHEPPYLIVLHVSSFDWEGPFNDVDADEDLRVQIIGVGDTREQADWARDLARANLTKDALNAQFVTDSLARKCLYSFLDLALQARYDRGIPDPVYNAVDQYRIKTTPS